MAKFIYFSGKGKWMHRLFEPDEYKGNRFWSFNLYLDPKSMKAFKESGLSNKVKEDEDGKFIKLRRNVNKPWKLKPGEAAEFTPPAIADPEGKDWPEDKLLGNGSAVTAKLELYETSKGRGGRLEAIRVDNWVEYDRPEEVTEEAPDDDVRPF